MVRMRVWGTLRMWAKRTQAMKAALLLLLLPLLLVGADAGAEAASEPADAGSASLLTGVTAAVLDFQKDWKAAGYKVRGCSVTSPVAAHARP